MKRLVTVVTFLFLTSGKAEAQIPVIDAAVLGQTVITVAKLTEEIKLTFDQLQNALLNTVPGATPWESALPLLLRLGNLLQRGQALGYTIKGVDQRFLTTFPGYIAPMDWHASYGNWTTTSLDTLRNVLGALGIQADSIAWDAARIGALAIANSSAAGRMAAIQAGNSIALEGIGQMQRLQEIARAQSNAYVVVEAQKLQEEAARNAMARKFLLDGIHPIPQYGTSGTGFSTFGLSR